MGRDWESTFQSWGKPPGKTEQEKSDHAETAIRKAIAASEAMQSRNVAVFPQGSYNNRTNVRADSDVDICIRCRDSFFFDVPPDTDASDFGISTPATYSYAEFKNDVERALKSYLGEEAVTRGNKAFDVHENTYRVDADAVACFEYRRYEKDGSYLEGTALNTDKGTRIINWPEQNYENGVTKNGQTGKRFKAIVRILKRLRNEMSESGYKEATPVPSFLVECLVWNVPNEDFNHDTFKADIRHALAHLFNNTRRLEDCKEWGEINELKYLFRSTQPWTREAAHMFLDAAWDYIGFK